MQSKAPIHQKHGNRIAADQPTSQPASPIAHDDATAEVDKKQPSPVESAGRTRAHGNVSSRTADTRIFDRRRFLVNVGKSLALVSAYTQGTSWLQSGSSGASSVARAANRERPTAMKREQTTTLPPTTNKIFVKFLPNITEEEREKVIVQQYNGRLVRWLPQLNTAIAEVPVATINEVIPPSGTKRSSAPMPSGDVNVKGTANAFGQVLSFFMRLFGILSEEAQVSRSIPQEVAAPLARSVTRIEVDGVVKGCEEGTLEPPPPLEINDPDINLAYGLTQIRATEAWSISVGTGCKVAVIDTGIDRDHPEFSGRLEPGFNYVNDTDQPDDDNGHGTHVAGLVGAAAGNGQGAAGSAPDCRIIPIKVLDNNNLGTWSDVVSGILFAVEAGADVINLSLGASSVPPDTVREAIEIAVDNAVVVAAAGNAATTMRFYPASFDGVVAVAGTTEQRVRWFPSNYGSWISVAAPAEEVYSTALGQSYEYRSGTSMAAGYVSGTCALIHQAGFKESGAIVQRLTRSAQVITDGDSTNRELGAGLIDAFESVEADDQIFIPFVT